MCACVTVSFIGEIQTPAKSTGTHKSLTDSEIFTLLNEKPFKRVCELNAWDILYLLRHFDVFFFFLVFVSSVHFFYRQGKTFDKRTLALLKNWHWQRRVSCEFLQRLTVRRFIVQNLASLSVFTHILRIR